MQTVYRTSAVSKLTLLDPLPRKDAPPMRLELGTLDPPNTPAWRRLPPPMTHVSAAPYIYRPRVVLGPQEKLRRAIPDGHDDAVVREGPQRRLENARKAKVCDLDAAMLVRAGVAAHDQDVGWLHAQRVCVDLGCVIYSRLQPWKIEAACSHEVHI